MKPYFHIIRLTLKPKAQIQLWTYYIPMSQCALVVFKLPSRMVAIFPQTTSCTDLGDIVIFVCVWLLSSRPIFGGIDCLRHTNNTHYYCNRA